MGDLINLASYRPIEVLDISMSIDVWPGNLVSIVIRDPERGTVAVYPLNYEGDDNAG